MIDHDHDDQCQITMISVRSTALARCLIMNGFPEHIDFKIGEVVAYGQACCRTDTTVTVYR